MTIDSYGDIDENGVRLARFLKWVQSEGVTRVWLVGHSNGGMWSRSAMDHRADLVGLQIASITTIDTPHNGSMIADLAQVVRGYRYVPCFTLDCKIRQSFSDQLQRKLIDEELPGAALVELAGSSRHGTSGAEF
jgi:pimeloyl-ACP methyl ester carboxylesterase